MSKATFSTTSLLSLFISSASGCSPIRELTEIRRISKVAQKITSETAIPNTQSIHQKYRPDRIPIRIKVEAMASLRWCQPSAISDRESVFRPLRIENRANASLQIIEAAKTTMARTL